MFIAYGFLACLTGITYVLGYNLTDMIEAHNRKIKSMEVLFDIGAKLSQGKIRSWGIINEISAKQSQDLKELQNLLTFLLDQGQVNKDKIGDSKKKLSA